MKEPARVPIPTYVLIVMLALPLCVRAAVDNFDDNTRDSTMWDYLVMDWEGALAERNQRLEYTSPGSSNGAPEDENSAYYRLKTPPAYRSAWMLRLDVHVELFDSFVPPSDYEYGMEVGIFNAADYGDRLWIGRYRGYDGPPPGIDNSWCVAKATDDSYVIDEFFQADANDGTIMIVWSGESMAIYRREQENESFQLLMDGIKLSDWGMSPGDTFDILIGGQDVGHPTALSDGQKLYCDNFALVSTSPASYEPQTVVFFDPSREYVFLVNSDGVISLAGEDYGAVRFVAINDNADSQGIATPLGGFSGNQGVVLGYDVMDESGNGAFCILSEAWSVDQGGPGGSGLPISLSNSVLHFDLAFTVPGNPSVETLNKVLSFWIIEADGDHFETEGIVDVTKSWQSYSYDLNGLASHPTFNPGGGVFGDSPVALLSIQFEDPDTSEYLESILYFLDNIIITGASDFFEDFEGRCLATLNGDMNNDCIVDFTDFGIMAADWLEDSTR